MPRKVDEWIGRTDDTPPPPRVLVRIFQREGGICHISGRKIQPGEKWQADHKIALINGGKNCESNLYPTLVAAHAEKTKLDVAEKSRVAERAKSHIGARRPSAHPMHGGKYICVNGHDRCHQMLPGPDCPYCERYGKPAREPKPPLVTAPGQPGIAKRYVNK